MIISPKTNCLNCNVEIDLYNKHVNKKNGRTYYNTSKIHKYCSSECFCSHRQKNAIRHCEFCKESFVTKPHMKKKFCSNYCAGKQLQNCNKVKSWEFVKRKPINLEKKYLRNKKYREDNKKQHAIKRKTRGIERKELLIKEFGGCCEFCGYNKCIRALTFHHVDKNEKKFTLDSLSLQQKKWELILQEAEKCQLLCFNCHMELHYNESN